MLPIAILPVAGLLLGLGSSFTNETTITTYRLGKVLGDGTILHALLVIMNKVGSAVFDNLPLLFAVGVAIGMAKKEKEVAALSAVIAYFVMNISISAMLVLNGEILEDGSVAEDVLTSRGFFKNIMSFQAENLILKISLMIMSIMFTALGMHFMLSMKIVQNPPDGTVNILAHLLKKNVGKIKVNYDIIMVIVSVAIGFIFMQDLKGVGIATVLSAIFVGKTLSLMKKYIPLVN